ncbi:hypothetical protein R1T43_02620 [Alteromonas sp. CI.11.F.A3]|nr:hypothetical protein [Alteromonas sp. CI.11.F.A3]WOI37955.1 hypothetical protein R1T43_02620 [Alteromonas sp. CI.11.F.A3]
MAKDSSVAISSMDAVAKAPWMDTLRVSHGLLLATIINIQR